MAIIKCELTFEQFVASSRKEQRRIQSRMNPGDVMEFAPDVPPVDKRKEPSNDGWYHAPNGGVYHDEEDYLYNDY